jgi:CO/xanthine dehydrogenase FAD-binding subunit
MELFELTQPTDVAQAVGALAKSAAERTSDVRIIAGGTT